MKLVMHTDANNVELEPALEKLLLDLRRDAVEADMALWENSIRSGHCVHGASQLKYGSWGKLKGRSRC